MSDLNEREVGLLNVLRSEEAREARQLEWFLYRRDHVKLGAILRSLAGLAQTRGLHAYFMGKSIVGLKQNFYVASKLTQESIGRAGGADFEIAVDLLFALLSDHAELINEFACLETPELLKERDNPLNSRFHVHMWQLAIRGDYDALHSKIEKVAKHGRKPERAESAAGRDFFSLLIKEDQPALEHLIQNRLARIQGRGAFFEDFMAYPAMIETKLCWVKGICVQIDNPRVPMELMPVKPLDGYDDVYEFLKPGWVPPRQGVIGKVSRWLSGKV